MLTTAIKRLRFWAPLAVSALIFYLLLVKIDARQTLASLRSCDFRLVGLAVLVSLSVNIFFGAEKWRRILAALGCPLPYREALAIRTACIPFKIIFPLKSSELLKALYLDRRGKLSFTRATGSLILDKTLNFLVIIPIALIGMTFVDLHISGIALLFVLALILLTVYSTLFRGGLIALATRIHPRLKGVSTGLLSGFAELGGLEKMILLIYSCIYQASEFFSAFILLKAVGVTVPFSYLLAVVPVIMVINNLPVTTLGLGTREVAMVFFFTEFGPAAALLSAGILLSLVEHVLPVATGLFFIQPFHAYFLMKNDVYSPETKDK